MRFRTPASLLILFACTRRRQWTCSTTARSAPSSLLQPPRAHLPPRANLRVPGCAAVERCRLGCRWHNKSAPASPSLPLLRLCHVLRLQMFFSQWSAHRDKAVCVSAGALPLSCAMRRVALTLLLCQCPGNCAASPAVSTAASGSGVTFRHVPACSHAPHGQPVKLLSHITFAGKLLFPAQRTQEERGRHLRSHSPHQASTPPPPPVCNASGHCTGPL